MTQPLLNRVETSASAHGLMQMGGLHDAGQTIVLLGASEGFWPIFRSSDEARDGEKDPIDRWSRRVMEHLMHDLGATRVEYPFGGPPYAPFIQWSLQSGQAWQSPAGMLVHERAGLMISYRGALVFDGQLPLPPGRKDSPCDTCAETPCMAACPVNALSAQQGYNVSDCHGFLDTDAGGDCMSFGCKARRACPVSQAFGRDPAQSAFHMKSFHPE